MGSGAFLLVGLILGDTKYGSVKLGAVRLLKKFAGTERTCPDGYRGRSFNVLLLSMLCLVSARHEEHLSSPLRIPQGRF
jgi:hypothetical protein